MSEAAIIQGQLVDARNVGVHKSFRLVVDVPAEHAAMVIEKLGWPTQASPIPVAIARLDVSKIGGNDVANGEAEKPHPGLASPSLWPEEVMPPESKYSPTDNRPDPVINKPPDRADKPLKERKPTKPEDRLKLKAALLCSAPAFWTFVGERYPDEKIHDGNNAAEESAAFVRRYCGVLSRREITPGTYAGDLFEQLYSDFTIWRDHPELVAS